jgi:hypothetical protein
VSYGLSTVYSPYGVSSLSTIVSYGLSSLYSPDGISSLSSIVSYGLSTVAAQPQYGVSSLSSIVSYGLSTIFTNISINLSSLSTTYGQIFNTSTFSTINMAAQIGFISTLSTTKMTTQILTTSSIITVSNVPISIPVTISTPNIQVSSIQMGSFGNIIDVTGPLRFITGSTINFYASSIMADGLQLGSTSNTSIFFDGLLRTYDLTTISEVAIPNTASNQELLLYKGGNSILDQIRLQTTGNVIIETQVGTRTWPSYTQGNFQSFFISGQGGNRLAQIGINTNITTIPSGVTLDVANATGTATIRAPIVSTTQIFTSSIAGATLFPVYWNTVVSSNATGTTLALTTSNLGSYVFVTSTAGTGSNVFVSFPTVAVPSGAFFVVNHKGANAASNNIVLTNTSYNIPVSTSKTSVFTGIEWVSI